MLISSLRDVIRNQTQEIEGLQRQLQEKARAGTDEVGFLPLISSITAMLMTLPSAQNLARAGRQPLLAAGNVGGEAKGGGEGAGGSAGVAGRGQRQAEGG
jgi:hypothetical protein